MAYAAVWFVVVILLAFWSLTTWLLHAVGVWTVTNAGALGGVASGAGPLRLPEWLAPWVPPEVVSSFGELFAALGPLVQGLLQAAPALSGAVTVTAWAVWAIGSLMLVMLGAAGHVGIVVWRRRSGLGLSRPERMVAAG